jgi:LuxR family maltose regulon positive regulatory protein
MLILENFTNPGPGAMQLILEKITIPPRDTKISRPRLLRLLYDSLGSCASTIINGRAGSGKTTLAADFARASGRAIAWYKVDAPDGDLQIFFNYLIASIEQQRPGFGRENLNPILRTATIEQIGLLAEAFVYELLGGTHEPLLIVIEDLHLVYDAELVVPFFRRLLPLLPCDVHVLITSRTMPPAPLWRLRSKQRLFVIEEAELAFTRQEASVLFEHHGLSREQASIALDHTHGRASALNSCAEALASEPGDTGSQITVAMGSRLPRPN